MRRRHHHDAQVVARTPGLARERETEIGVNAPLVKLVDDDRAERREQRILLQPRRQDALGGDEQPRVGRELAVEAHVPADFAAERPPCSLRDAPGDRARRNAPRLQQQHRTVARPAPAERASSCRRQALR